MELLESRETENLSIDSNPIKYLQTFYEYILDILHSISEANLNQPKTVQRFERNMIISFILSSNKLEGTWPGNSSNNQTYSILQKLIEDLFSPNSTLSLSQDVQVKWNSEGANNNGDKCAAQLSQHLRAFWNLCKLHKSEDLSVQLLHDTHRILLLNSVGEDNQPILSGKFRINPAFSSSTLPNAPFHTFPSELEVPRLLSDVVLRYNQRRLHRDVIFANPLVLAASLFFEFIDVHPYVNGNGRLARMLFAYSLIRDGFPFPVPLQCDPMPRENSICKRSSEPVAVDSVLILPWIWTTFHLRVL